MLRSEKRGTLAPFTVIVSESSWCRDSLNNSEGEEVLIVGPFSLSPFVAHNSRGMEDWSRTNGRSVTDEWRIGNFCLLSAVSSQEKHPDLGLSLGVVYEPNSADGLSEVFRICLSRRASIPVKSYGNSFMVLRTEGDIHISTDRRKLKDLLCGRSSEFVVSVSHGLWCPWDYLSPSHAVFGSTHGKIRRCGGGKVGGARVTALPTPVLLGLLFQGLSFAPSIIGCQ